MPLWGLLTDVEPLPIIVDRIPVWNGHLCSPGGWYTFIYKAILWLLPTYICILILQRSVISHSWRINNKLFLWVPFACTHLGKWPLFFSALSSWNRFQEELKSINKAWRFLLIAFFKCSVSQDLDLSMYDGPFHPIFGNLKDGKTYNLSRDRLKSCTQLISQCISAKMDVCWSSEIRKWKL